MQLGFEDILSLQKLIYRSIKKIPFKNGKISVKVIEIFTTICSASNWFKSCKLLP